MRKRPRPSSTPLPSTPLAAASSPTLHAATFPSPSTPGIHDRLTPRLRRRPHSLSSLSALAPASPRVHDRLSSPRRRRPRSLPARLARLPAKPPAMSAPSVAVAPAPMSPLLADAWHRALSHTDGRDKLFRLVQYVCKLVRGLECGRGSPAPHSSAALVHALEAALGTSRQIWRLLKWASVYAKSRARVSALRAATPLPDVAAVAADVAMFLYYLSDNVTFLHKVGVLKGDVKTAGRRAARFWLAAVVAGLAGSVHSAAELAKRETVLRKKIAEKSEDEGESRREYYATLRRKRAVMAVCAKQGGDAVVAFSLCGVGDVHPAVVGACGVVSSAVGCWQVWPKVQS